MKDKLSNNIILLMPVFISIILGIIFPIKFGLLFYGIFNLGLYIQITVTTLSNALLGSGVNSANDTFWKLLLLLISSLSFAIFFAL